LARTRELAQSEARYRWALTAGQLVHWETDLIAGTRTWTKEAMALFGLSFVDGRGRFGGDADEFKLALHPDDRHLADKFYELADKQDWHSSVAQPLKIMKTRACVIEILSCILETRAPSLSQ
jgi:hypothetical protein